MNNQIKQVLKDFEQITSEEVEAYHQHIKTTLNKYPNYIHKYIAILTIAKILQETIKTFNEQDPEMIPHNKLIEQMVNKGVNIHVPNI